MLHIAASKSDDSFTTFFLENGATVDIEDREGKTALHIAVEHDRIKNVTKLLQHGANVDAQNSEYGSGKGITPLQSAILNDNLDIVKKLLEFHLVVRWTLCRGVRYPTCL